METEETVGAAVSEEQAEVEGDKVLVGEALGDVEEEDDNEGEGERVGKGWEGVTETVLQKEGLGLLDIDAETVALTVELALGEGEGVSVRAGLPDAQGVALGVAVEQGEGDEDTELEDVGLWDDPWLRVRKAEFETLML